MSLRHVEEGLTALSYPHVAYYLRGEQGYGNAGAAAGAAAGSAAGSAATSAGTAAAGAGGRAAAGAAGGGFGIIGAIAGAIQGIAGAITAFQMTEQAKELTKQTAAQTEAQKEIAQANVDIAYSQERIRKREADVQEKLNRNMYLLQMQKAQSLPVVVGAGLAGVVVLGVLFAPSKGRATSSNQTQRQKSRVQQTQRSL